MKKLDYLKLAVSQKLHHKRAWILSAFSITKPVGSPEPYKLISQSWGYEFLNAEGQMEKIDDSSPNIPLFHFKDPILIDNTWCPNVTEALETTIGNLLFNLICIVESFGTKMPYVTGRVSVVTIEDIIAKRLLDTPESPEKRSEMDFHVDEYLKFVDSLSFIKSLSFLCSISATRKSVLPPTGIKEFKQALLKKYEGKLTDPVELTKFEKELMAFDDAFLKDDPGYGTFLKGKVKDTARKKMYLNLGAEMAFTNNMKVEPVIPSLNEGWPTDPKAYSAMMNGSRAASYSRGAETVKGGVSAKYLLRSANNFHIQDTDCKTTLGIHRLYTESIIEQLIGRYVVDKNTSVHIENKNAAANYLNKEIIVRSPMYCRLDGDNICKVCAGDNINKYPTGVTIPLTEISSIILNSNLKLMHTNALSTAKLDIRKAFT